jgi:hypothetical protein
MNEYIYVAGPITVGGEFGNVRRAVIEASILLEAGYTPFVPHLTCFWDMLVPKEYEAWLRYDFRWIERVDTLLQLPGQSSGANRETAFARSLGKNIFYGNATEFIDAYGLGPNAAS